MAISGAREERKIGWISELLLVRESEYRKADGLYTSENGGNTP
jgi:hypothetical protein